MTQQPIVAPDALMKPVVVAPQVAVTTPQVAGTVGVTTTLPPVSKVTRVLSGGGQDPLWYLSRDLDLENVTNESSNMHFGIKSIIVRAATPGQMANYTIANVTLETVLGKIMGIQIKESRREAGQIYVQESSRNIAKEGQPANWMSDLKLERAVQAQILSFVHDMLVPSNA